jgi:hypothetical protein
MSHDDAVERAKLAVQEQGLVVTAKRMVFEESGLTTETVAEYEAALRDYSEAVYRFVVLQSRSSGNDTE